MAARGWGRVDGTATRGAAHSPARWASSPPEVMATTLAPCRAASVVACKVSSVSPENETAKTSDVSLTKAGHS